MSAIYSFPIPGSGWFPIFVHAGAQPLSVLAPPYEGPRIDVLDDPTRTPLTVRCLALEAGADMPTDFTPSWVLTYVGCFEVAKGLTTHVFWEAPP